MSDKVIMGQPDAPKSAPTPGAQKSGQGVSLDSLIKWCGTWQATSNITALRVLYSIKNRKFIKGYLKGHAGKGEIVYKVYPGTYVYFFYFSWRGNDPPKEIKIELLHISENEQILSKIMIKFYDAEFLKQFPPQVFDFYKSIPLYHGRPHLDFNKNYSEEENKALLEFISKGGEITEGAEHD